MWFKKQSSPHLSIQSHEQIKPAWTFSSLCILSFWTSLKQKKSTSYSWKSTWLVDLLKQPSGPLRLLFPPWLKMAGASRPHELLPPLCLRTHSQRDTTSHTEEKAPVTHGDAPSHRIPAAAWRFCVIYAANVHRRWWLPTGGHTRDLGRTCWSCPLCVCLELSSQDTK